MRIFFASPATAHQTGLPSSQLWHINLYLPLLDLGHDLTVFDHDYRQANLHLNPKFKENLEFIALNRPIFSEKLVNQVKKAHAKKPINLFFSYFYSSYVTSEAIREIGKMGIITVNWYANASYQFDLVSKIAPAYDYCLVPEKFRLSDYKKIGAHPIYCQEAANPNFYKPFNLPKTYDVTFAGQKYGDRPHYIRTLIDNKIKVNVWGPGWRSKTSLVKSLGPVGALKHLIFRNNPNVSPEIPAECLGDPLPDDSLIKMYSQSKISLGFSRVWKPPDDGPDKQVRLRDFEATMSGAFYLVEYFKDLSDFFVPDKEIVFFRDKAELVDKARYYLSHDREREKIRLAGRRRALKDHTWHKRFTQIFKKICAE